MTASPRDRGTGRGPAEPGPTASRPGRRGLPTPAAADRGAARTGPCDQLVGQAALSTARLPGYQDETTSPGEGVVQRANQLRQLRLPSHERAPLRFNRSFLPQTPIECRVLFEHRGVKALEIAPGLNAQALHKRGAGLLVGLERLGLPTGAVESEDQLPLEAFAQRLARHQVVQLADDRGVAAELEIGGHAVLQGGRAQLFEPRYLRLTEGLVGEIRERPAAPEVERIAQRFGSGSGIASRE